MKLANEMLKCQASRNFLVRRQWSPENYGLDNKGLGQKEVGFIMWL